MKRKKRRKRKAKSGDDAPKYINPVAEYLPVEKIDNGIIYSCEKCGGPYVLGGSIRDDLVIECCDKYGMVMAFTGMRLFHH